MFWKSDALYALYVRHKQHRLGFREHKSKYKLIQIIL